MIQLAATRVTGEFGMVVDGKDAFLYVFCGEYLVALVISANNDAVFVNVKGYSLPLIKTAQNFGAKLIVQFCRREFLNADVF